MAAKVENGRNGVRGQNVKENVDVVHVQEGENVGKEENVLEKQYKKGSASWKRNVSYQNVHKMCKLLKCGQEIYDHMQKS